MKRTIVFCLLFFSFAGNVHAASEIVSRKVTAAGETRELAIINSVIEGIRQVHGVSIDTQRELRVNFSEVLQSGGDSDEESFYSSTDQIRNVRSRAKGYVKSYNVLSVHRQTNSVGWEATVIVEVPIYLSTGQDRSQIRTMAVLPFRVQSGSYTVGSQTFPAEEVSWQLNHKLISELTQARKFRMLDREYVEEYGAEKALLKSGEVPVEETLRLGQRLGSDFMIVGIITGYKIIEGEKVTLGVARVDRTVDLVFEYRVIEVAPQEIRWSGSVDLTLDHKSLRNLTTSDDLMQVQNVVLSKAAATVASEVLEVIFPVKVLGVVGNEVALNQGGIRIKEGQLFDVFTIGNKVIDPDTGRKIRIDGPRVATIEVINVLPKYSIARVIDGDIEQVVERAICRQAGTQEELKKKTASSASLNW